MGVQFPTNSSASSRKNDFMSCHARAQFRSDFPSNLPVHFPKLCNETTCLWLVFSLEFWTVYDVTSMVFRSVDQGIMWSIVNNKSRITAEVTLVSKHLEWFIYFTLPFSGLVSNSFFTSSVSFCCNSMLPITDVAFNSSKTSLFSSSFLESSGIKK